MRLKIDQELAGDEILDWRFYDDITKRFSPTH